MNIIKKRRAVELKGLVILNGSWYYRKSIRGQRLSLALGREETLTKDQAVELALKAYKKASDLGVDSFKALGLNTKLSRLASNSQTFNDVLVAFLEAVKRTGSKKTKGRPFRQAEVQNYDKEKRMRWADLLGLPIDSIKEEHIRLWNNEITQRKNPDGSYQISSAYTSLTRLTRVFNWAVEERIIKANPALHLSNSGNRVVPVKRKPKSEERLNIATNELGKFLFSLMYSKPKQDKRNNDTARDVIIMALMTGARAEEIFHMRWDWIPDKIDFKYIIAPAESRGDKRFEGTKGRRDYYYACSQIVQEMLKTRYNNRKILNKKLGGDAGLTYVFPNSKGSGPIYNVRKRIKSICLFAGIKKTISMHDFRRTFADVCGATPFDRPAFADRIIKRAIQHASSDITFGLYMDNDADTLQVHGIFQHVEEFCSQAIYAGTIFDIFLRQYNSTGLRGISKDNKTIEDDRAYNPDSLRVYLYSDDKIRTKLMDKIQAEEEKVLRYALGKRFKKESLKEIMNFSNVMLDSMRLGKAKKDVQNYAGIKKILSKRLEQYKGDIVVFRMHVPLIFKIAQTMPMDKIRKKFPDVFPIPPASN